MSIFTPSHRYKRVAGISPAALRAAGIRGILLDVDNTLSPHNAPTPEPDAVQWLRELAQSGIAVMIVSNNHAPRVAPFAARLGLPYVSRGAKPLPVGFRRAQRMLGLPRAALAVVGDQLFTDILGGNLAGMTTWLVDPICPETGWFFRLKRALERPLLRNVRYTQ